jgi:hypothetical protein
MGDAMPPYPLQTRQLNTLLKGHTMSIHDMARVLLEEGDFTCYEVESMSNAEIAEAYMALSLAMCS